MRIYGKNRQWKQALNRAAEDEALVWRQCTEQKEFGVVAAFCASHRCFLVLLKPLFGRKSVLLFLKFIHSNGAAVLHSVQQDAHRRPHSTPSPAGYMGYMGDMGDSSFLPPSSHSVQPRQLRMQCGSEWPQRTLHNPSPSRSAIPQRKQTGTWPLPSHCNPDLESTPLPPLLSSPLRGESSCSIPHPAWIKGLVENDSPEKGEEIFSEMYFTMMFNLLFFTVIAYDGELFPDLFNAAAKIREPWNSPNNVKRLESCLITLIKKIMNPLRICGKACIF